MSTDYSAVCDVCKTYVHIGQRMAGVASFGYGSNDEEGRKKAAKWCFEHVEHSDGVRIVFSQSVPTHYLGDDD